MERSGPEHNESFTSWALPVPEVISFLGSNEKGLSEREVLARRVKGSSLKEPNSIKNDLFLFLRQFKSPLILILIVAVILSSALREYTNSAIILSIVLLTGIIGFWQERKANQALHKLLAMVQVKTSVLRNQVIREIPIEDIVTGDIVLLNAGDIIPGDCRLIESNDLHVNEAALTGESFPVEKEVVDLPVETDVAKRKNCIYQGTSVVSGTAKAIVFAVGANTEFGVITTTLSNKYPETTFEAGIKKFGYLLMKITLIIALVIISINVYLGKVVVDSFLFGLSLALGMTPELLPAIVSITLAAGAKRMADKKVIVKRLESIQNLGSINVLCADKTGTITEGIVKVVQTVDPEGNHSDKTRKYGYLNALFETGFTNPLDEALRHLEESASGYIKFDEVPYDFVRKRLSIVVNTASKHLMITKGAVQNILDVCVHAEIQSRILPLDDFREKIMLVHKGLSAKGYRTIGVAWKDVTDDPVINKDDESDMIFLGFLILADPAKPGIDITLKNLSVAGVAVKLITGDNEFVAAHLSEQIGLDHSGMLTGKVLRTLSDEALTKRVSEVNVYAETEPYQKERIIRALKKSGYSVGYIGDGINDVSAMRAADVSISVEDGADVAKEAADIVLLEKDLEILKDGVYEGRKTFVNTMKYIFITSSANFGNMFSMAGASLLLPFLPLSPKQILLTNFLTDIPAMTLPKDQVDNEQIKKPGKWNTAMIRNFMIVFGLESSLFDMLTFVILFAIVQVNEAQFQTSWFVESVITEIFMLIIIRTQRSIFKSIPGKQLIITSIIITLMVAVLPYLPFASALGFIPLSFTIVLAMILISVLYCITAEITKRIFFAKLGR